jgi:hypothetical protein
MPVLKPWSAGVIKEQLKKSCDQHRDKCGYYSVLDWDSFVFIVVCIIWRFTPGIAEDGSWRIRCVFCTEIALSKD